MKCSIRCSVFVSLFGNNDDCSMYKKPYGAKTIFMDNPTQGDANYLLHISHLDLLSKLSLGRKFFDDIAQTRPFYPNPDGSRIFKHFFPKLTP